MLLTITYTGENAPVLGYLLYKNPNRPQVVELNHGKAYVFYPEVTDTRTTVALLLEINPIDLSRGKEGSSSGGLFEYVNDRPYVSSSFMSTAISRVFGTAISGRADDYQAVADSFIDLSAVIYSLPCKGDTAKLNSVFEPLGYTVHFESIQTNENFPGWNEKRFVNLTISGKVRLRDLLKHIYVLIPVFDRKKHYWVGSGEVEKLLRMGEGWLAEHPEKAFITGRYFDNRKSLVNLAYERLHAAEKTGEDEDVTKTATDRIRQEQKQNLNNMRIGSVLAALKNSGAKRVIDMGCGEGALLRELIKEGQFTNITGLDVSHMVLKRANEKLRPDKAGESTLNKLNLIQGSLTYKDSRFEGYDAACVIEVIEHLDIPRLTAFERVLFEFAKPPVVIITTPNRDYNTNYENLKAGEFRHTDHRFEFSREEFRNWATNAAGKFGYKVDFSEIGIVDDNTGAPTQMGVFTICE